MEKRSLGKTGEKLTLVGFGGIAVRDETPADAAALVAQAVNERGINYFDVAPSNGNAEERLGPALEPYRRRGDAVDLRIFGILEMVKRRLRGAGPS